MSTYVDIHIIQNLPPSCVNRDDTGSPKSAVYGGVRRLRISSQSWKHATRLYFQDHLDSSELGTRTKRVVGLLASEITTQAADLADDAENLAEEIFKAAGIKTSSPRTTKGAAPKPAESGYLIFLSYRQIVQLAELAVKCSHSGAPLDKKAVKTIFKSDNSIDVALFGRMVADDADLNVDAACQVAHALSTHAAENEYDFFTAVDDAKARSDAEEDVGAGMMGTVEFSSATVYRYATVNLDMLHENLGDKEATLRALTAFVDGFATSMPTGKQNTFANRTLPDAIVVMVRDDQPISFVGAFEEAVKQDSSRGYVARSIDALATYADKVVAQYGLEPQESFVVALDDSDAVNRLGRRVTYKELSTAVRASVQGSNSETDASSPEQG
ncbi:type I-E CRISPR-associated protein Cas7/Cse4/CasC [Actinobaculum sp. 313]|uniref:type I-E CRISPR-associated protein Cas7/Cse4/CasC n=1 Tax=Actinobaculum sp. 313 TaxID=2495645 RepID=UPI000D528D32|nr:type I-E CRISPR-associated protein Cas7/Cse4/CasC [Actinobaculum sp. 313]AWE41589.1 type I-E CRISPR-associated protein Cas7/Cse4/CasC [Actinobaculum sp. 313]